MAGPTPEAALSPYPGVITMLVESYALSSAWSLGTVISLVLDSPSFLLFSINDSTVRVRDFLVILWVFHTPLIFRSSPTFLLFTALKQGEDGPSRQGKDP